MPKAVEDLAKEQGGLKLVKCALGLCQSDCRRHRRQKLLPMQSPPRNRRSASKQGSYTVWNGDRLTVLVGDFFKFSDTKKFDKAWFLTPSPPARFVSGTGKVLLRSAVQNNRRPHS